MRNSCNLFRWARSCDADKPRAKISKIERIVAAQRLDPIDSDFASASIEATSALAGGRMKINASGKGKAVTTAAQVREKVDHPIIDADGHFVEIGPVLEEELVTYLEEAGGRQMRDRYLASWAK